MTKIVLVALLDGLLREANQEGVILLALLDLSAAFSIVDHSILLAGLLFLGIGGSESWKCCFVSVGFVFWSTARVNHLSSALQQLYVATGRSNPEIWCLLSSIIC